MKPDSFATELKYQTSLSHLRMDPIVCYSNVVCVHVYIFILMSIVPIYSVV